MGLRYVCCAKAVAGALQMITATAAAGQAVSDNRRAVRHPTHGILEKTAPNDALWARFLDNVKVSLQFSQACVCLAAVLTLSSSVLVPQFVLSVPRGWDGNP